MESALSRAIVIIALTFNLSCTIGKQIHYTPLLDFKPDIVGVSVHQMQRRDDVYSNKSNKRDRATVPLFIIEQNNRKDPKLFFNTPEELISFYKNTLKYKKSDGIFLHLAPDDMYSVSDRIERKKLIESCQENNIVVYVFYQTSYPPFIQYFIADVH